VLTCSMDRTVKLLDFRSNRLFSEMHAVY
jgi:hypothetical protein